MSNSNGAFITKQQVIDFVRDMKNIESEEFTLRKTVEQLKNVEPQRKALVAEIEESEKRVGKIYDTLVDVEGYYKGCKSYLEKCYNHEWIESQNERKNQLIERIKKIGAREERVLEYQEFIAENNIEFERPPIDPPQCPPKPKNYDQIKAAGIRINGPIYSVLEKILILIRNTFLSCVIITVLLVPIMAMIPKFQNFIFGIFGNLAPFIVFGLIPLILGVLSVILISIEDIKDYIKYGNHKQFLKMYEYEYLKENYESVYLLAFYWYEIQRYYHHKHRKEKQEKLSAFATQSKKQADLLLAKADEIKYTKREIYRQFPIIPPDYRTCDCVLMLHHYFRNNLADTMRDAILLYKEDVFRGEIIQGMQKIYDMLGNLTRSMKSIESQVRLIKNNVSFMVNDMQKAIEKHIDSTENFQNVLLNEAQAMKYAMESVKRSNELLLLHQNQQRGTYYQ